MSNTNRRTTCLVQLRANKKKLERPVADIAVLMKNMARQKNAVARPKLIGLVSYFDFDITFQNVKGLLLVGVRMTVARDATGLVFVGVDHQPLCIHGARTVFAARSGAEDHPRNAAGHEGRRGHGRCRD